MSETPGRRSDTGAERGSGLRAVDTGNQARRDTSPAGKVLGMMLGVLALSALINGETMLHRAETSQLGSSRDLALSFWRPVESAGSAAGFTRVRQALDSVRAAGERPDDDPAPRLASEVYTPAGSPVPAAAPPSARPTAAPDVHRSPGRQEPPGTPGTGPVDPAGPVGPPDQAGSMAATPAPSILFGLPTGGAPPPTVAAPSPTTSQPAGQAPSRTVTGTSSQPAGFRLRRPTAADPLRILIAGDSTVEAVGTSISRHLAETGVTDVRLDHRVSTGLARPDFFDWPAHLSRLRSDTGFEVAVIMLGANDAQPFVVEGHPESFGTELWLSTYRARVAVLLDQLTAGGGWVVWIGQPVMRNGELDARMRQLNQVYADEADRYPTVVYLDTREITSDQDGAYAAYLPDTAGDRQLVRTGDGVHLTTAGADRLSPGVVEALNAIAPLY